MAWVHSKRLSTQNVSPLSKTSQNKITVLFLGWGDVLSGQTFGVDQSYFSFLTYRYSERHISDFHPIWAWWKIEAFLTTPQKLHNHKIQIKIFQKMCFKIFKNNLNIIFLNFEFSSKPLKIWNFEIWTTFTKKIFIVINIK